MSETFEPQYQEALILASQERRILPCMANQTWITDPKRLAFMLTRYKHVGVMMQGKTNVLEVGCGDGFGSNVTANYVERLFAIDADELLISEANAYCSRENITFASCKVGSKLPPNFPLKYSGVFALDVFEHIPPVNASRFAQFITSSLLEHGQFVCGIPSLESQPYASSGSKAGHVNCLSGSEFKSFWQQYFYSVSLFGMNDEVLHTGFPPMAHYLIVLCSSPK